MSAHCPPQEQLERLLDDRLEATEDSAVARHVESCAQCQARLEQLLAGSLSSLGSAQTNPEMSDAVLIRLKKHGRRGDQTVQLLGQQPLADRPSNRTAALPEVPGYEVLSEIGRGGMGVIYKARHLRLGRVVALKMILVGAHSPSETLRRFHIEASAVARLAHPGIVGVYDVGEHAGLPYLSLELVEGGSLKQLLAGTPQPPRESARLMEQLARAVQHAHDAGIVHRDLKPANVLLSSAACGLAVESEHGPAKPQAARQLIAKITDFGLAKLLTEGPSDGPTQSGAVVGTPGYMAPEQAAGHQRQIGPAADIYALGAILYECLTGRPPFQAATTLETLLQVMHDEPVSISRLQPQVPRDLATIAMRCLEKQPVKRYASARDLADDLGRFLAGRPIHARRVGPLERGWRWCRRNPGVAGLLALVILVLLGGIAVSTSFGLEAQKRAGETDKALDQARTEEGNARAAEKKATQEATKAQAAKRASDLEAARLKFRDAIGQAQAGAVDLGLYGLIEALRLAPDDADAAPFRRALCTSFAFWSRQLLTLRYVLENQDLPDDSLIRTVGKDGKYFMTSTGRHHLQLREMATGRPIEPRWQLAGNESITGFTPDNALVLTRTVKDGKAFLQLRDTVTGKPAVGRFSKPSHGPASPFTGPKEASYLPILVWSNEAVAAFRTAEGQRFWDLAGARWYPLSLPKEARLLPLLLSRDRKPLAVVFHPAPQFSPNTPRLEFWDVTTGKSVPFPVRLAAGSDESVTLDGRIFATVEAGHCRWWDLDTGRLIDRWWPRQGGDFRNRLPDAQTLLVQTDDRIRLFALDTGLQRGGNLAEEFIGEPIGLTYHGGPKAFRAWNTQALALQATAAANPSVRLFAGDADRPEQTRELFNNGLVSPNGKLAFFNRTKNGQEYGRLVDVVRRQPIGPALRSQRDRQLMVFSPDEKLLALAPYNYHASAPLPEVHVYDTATGRLRLPPLRMPTFILSLAFTPDGRTLVVGGVGQTVLLDAQTGQPRGVLPQASVAYQLAVSPDGTALAIGYLYGWPGDGPGFRLWDITRALPIGPFHPGGDWEVSFIDQGRTVLTVNRGGVPRLFDRQTGQPSVAALPPGDMVAGRGVWGNRRIWSSIAARSRDAVFAFRSSAGTVEQWDTAAGHAVGEPMVHPWAVLRMQYSPDGRLLATACADNSVRLWDSATGLPLGPPLLHVAPVLSLCFAASGVAEKGTSEAYHLVTASAAGEIHDWPLPAAFPDNPERLTLWLEAAAGCKQGRTDTALLDAATWRERCRQLEERWPEAAAALAKQRGADLSAELTAWHEVRAGEAEATGNAFGQLWHLDRLAELRPDDWRLEARRGTVLADNDDFAAAEAAFAFAAKKGAGEALADWHSHGAAMASGARRWQLARWYLDRQIAARPNDWRPYADRAEIHGQLGNPSERDADLERAVAHGAEQPLVLRLAESRARLRQWQKAAGLYRKAAGQGPLPLAARHQLALVCLKIGDVATYRSICKGLVGAAGKTSPSPDLANAIAWMCALGPTAVKDFAPVVALAEGAVKVSGDARQRHERLNTLGAVYYRSGRYQDAIDRLAEGIRQGGKADVHDLVFLAMAHHQLGHAREAKDLLTKARAEKQAADAELFWQNLEIGVLLEEAVKLPINSASIEE